MTSLSFAQARKLVLLSQQLSAPKRNGTAIDKTLSSIEHLGYIQIDTISVVQRAHHHTLWSRNPRYKTEHIDKLIEQKKIFEYWSHAAAYLPMQDFRFSLPRKQLLASGVHSHWYKPHAELVKSVLKRIEDEGPLMAKDFSDGEVNRRDWGSKPSKQALEQLFMRGDLMVPYRKNFHKVYDLTQRVLPANVDRTPPDDDEYTRFLVTRYLQANGIGQIQEILYLLKSRRALVVATLNEMLLAGEVIQVEVGKSSYYALPESLELLNKPIARQRLKILSPFDNLLIQRKRIQELFGFDYLLECYLPKAKRQYGYFSLPILWDTKLVARMDCKANRKESQLEIFHLVLEPSLTEFEAFASAFTKELRLFMQFNNCQTVKLHQTTPKDFTSVLKPIGQQFYF